MWKWATLVFSISFLSFGFALRDPRPAVLPSVPPTGIPVVDSVLGAHAHQQACIDWQLGSSVVEMRDCLAVTRLFPALFACIRNAVGAESFTADDCEDTFAFLACGLLSRVSVDDLSGKIALKDFHAEVTSEGGLTCAERFEKGFPGNLGYWRYLAFSSRGFLEEEEHLFRAELGDRVWNTGVGISFMKQVYARVRNFVRSNNHIRRVR